MTVDHHKTIVARLEDAGRTLMMLPMPARGMPGQASSAWPDYAQRYWDVFGHAEQDESDTEARREAAADEINDVRVQASNRAIDRLDEVLSWLWWVKDARYRRVIVARMQVYPLSDLPYRAGRHVYSWRRLMPIFQTSLWHLQQWHKEGIDDILRGLYAEFYRR